MLSHAWFFSRMGLLFHVVIGCLTYAASRISLFTYGSTFSTHGLALSRMLSDARALSCMGLMFHAWIGSLTYAF